MLHQELTYFCQNWLDKADEIDGSTLPGFFDKFFTLYVVYNRLYIEVTFRMARDEQNGFNLRNKDTFPDTKAAKTYVIQYLTSSYINQEFNSCQECLDAIESLKNILKEEGFRIKLHQVKGTPLPEKDKELLRHLKSSDTDKKIRAITDFIYSIRCNTFHGQKNYIPDQAQIFKPVNILLRKFIDMLFDKLHKE